MDRKDTVTSGTGSIQFMFGNCPVVLSFKEHLQCFLLIIGLLFSKSFYDNITFWIFLNIHLALIVFIEEIA